MRFEIACTDRNTGQPYTIVMDARSLGQAAQLASLSGHIVAEAEPAPVVVPVARPRAAAAVAASNASTDGFSVTSLVLGILSIPGSIIPVVGAALGISALVFAMFGRRGSAIRIAGLTTSLLGVGFSLALQILGILLLP